MLADRPEIASALTAADRVEILSEALPYLQRFHNKTIVVKYGGAAMKDPALKALVIKDIALLACVGINTVMVHGGGPEINKWLGDLGIEPNFHNGLRVTDEATMEVVEMVLTGRVNKGIVSMINFEGGSAVGLCGKDDSLFVARKTRLEELGYVGEITKVNPKIVQNVVEAGSIPVIASVATDSGDGHSLNINADIAAGELAAALGAEKLILMTDVPGVMQNRYDMSTLFRELDTSKAQALMAEGIIEGGMIPKVNCCLQTLSQGVKAAHIIDGRQPHSLLQEVLTDEGVGTMVSDEGSSCLMDS